MDNIILAATMFGCGLLFVISVWWISTIFKARVSKEYFDKFNKLFAVLIGAFAVIFLGGTSIIYVSISIDIRWLYLASSMILVNGFLILFTIYWYNIFKNRA